MRVLKLLYQKQKIYFKVCLRTATRRKQPSVDRCVTKNTNALSTCLSCLTPASSRLALSVTWESLSTKTYRWRAHVSHITSVCFFHLRQLRLIRRCLTTDAAHALVRALIHSRLDSCNGLFAGLPAVQFARLQSVLRAAARLVLGLPGRAPVSAVMSDSLHWLNFPQRVTFKLCL